MLIAIDAALASDGSSVDTALAAGATVDEIVGMLCAVAPVVGFARVVAAAPLADALGVRHRVRTREALGSRSPLMFRFPTFLPASGDELSGTSDT